MRGRYFKLVAAAAVVASVVPTPDSSAGQTPSAVDSNWSPGTVEIVQTPEYVFFLQEFNHGYRVVPIDRRPHIGENIKLFMGDSRGRWEGNTLVVDVTSNNDRTWFDMVGDFHSDALRISERFTPVGPDTIRYEATFEDPKVYTRPFTIVLTFGRVVRGEAAKSYQLMEEACLEGERNMELMLYKMGDAVK